MKYFYHKKEGYSLVEVLVAVAVEVLVAVAVGVAGTAQNPKSAV